MERNVADELNREFGNDVKNLRKAKNYHASLMVRKQEIEQRLKSSKGGSDPEQLKGLLGFARESLEKMQILEGVHGKILNDVSAHLDNASLVKKEFESSLADIQKLLRLKQYLQWIAKIEETRCAHLFVYSNCIAPFYIISFLMVACLHLHNSPLPPRSRLAPSIKDFACVCCSESIEEAMSQGQDEQAVSHVSFLLQVWRRVRASACIHLVDFLRETILYWHQILRDKFEKEFNKVLHSMGWPILNTGVSAPVSYTPELLLPFEKSFINLHKIQLPEGLEGSQLDVGSTTSVLPLELMLRPLKKRFLFHFTGKRQTNRLDKPEWYLSQILTWATDHGEFCDRFVQAILVKAGVEGMQARLLTHAIEEVLLFDRELRSQGYPPFYPCILNVLTADHCFIRWIALEKKYADEKRDVLLSSPTAWKPRFPMEGDIDELKVPECADSFMMILSAMTERYRHLEQPYHRLKFVSLQQILLEDWRLCLQQILTARLEELDLVGICPIVNAAHYVVQVLAQWSLQPFFVELLEACNEMQQKEKQRRQSTKQANSETVDPEEALFLAASETPSDESGQLVPMAEYGTLQESVFEEVSQLLEKLYTDTVLAIVDELVLDFKAKSKAYRREKWFCMPSLNDREDAGLTPTAFPMLSWLQATLQQLQEALAAPLFNTLWQEAARGISVFLYEELILENFFSEGGAMQLSFDMNRNLFPLFSAYSQKPENHLKEVKEACILLTMPHPVAWILQETLRAARATDVVTGGTALEEQGVSFLTPSQAMHVLSKRNDLVHT
ncbi:hypothetical protein HPB51_015025 [Rhipicephalus microplus]|uniref:Uncharacterized protein n=1 Tax=Rhipicephalus microplus TaxID=6941 RepID=A0A9J6ETS5_RHIMP|nr:hypothetical protein HPB51_015025 [Rhipicephalus microplus]